MRLIYHPDAEAELIEAAQCYEARVPHLGTQFLDAADIAVSMVLEAPARWRIIDADVRRYAMRRFPYFIYYRALQITSVFLPLRTTAVIPITAASVCRESP